MKKLLFPLASLIIGSFCSVAIISHQTPARVRDQVDDRFVQVDWTNTMPVLPIQNTNNRLDEEVKSSGVPHSTRQGEAANLTALRPTGTITND